MNPEKRARLAALPRWRRWLRRIVRWGGALVLLGFAALLVAYVRSSNACDEPSPPPAHPMTAVVYCEYGTAEVLRIEQVERPVPGDEEILVRVRAAAVNPLDWHYLRGTPYLMRADAGLRKPKSTRLGVDFAGTVEAIGRSVTRFKPGDDVFGGRRGAFAQYVRVAQDGAVALKPPSVTFEEAASVPIAGVTALQSLRDEAKVRRGDTVLINGASGGVGTFGVQIAKSLGAEVTGVCSGRNADLVRSLGADRVVDYTKEDFAREGRLYDAIVDNVGNRSLGDIRRALAPEGRYVLIGGGGPDDHRWVGPVGRIAFMKIRSGFGKQHLGFYIADITPGDLELLGGMMVAGTLRPVIDRRYPLAEAAEALRYVETGRARGKVVLTVE